jgi:pimeloyl-ACP methyl ester carboxylesterase
VSETEALQVKVGRGAEARTVAALRRSGREPGVFWLGGLKSDMAGSKAEALDRWAAQSGHAFTRFDYSGHGRSEGRFEDGTISRWLKEAETVIATLTDGPQIVVGSSMGGWIALLLARKLLKADIRDKLAGMILIAPAVDMTRTLMWDLLDDDARAEFLEKGFHAQPSDYSDEPYLITRRLIEDGRRHLFGGKPIETGCPVHVIQGMQDTDVPWTHATELMEKFAYDDAVLTLVRDGDHRLSREEDLERLIRAVEAMIAG